MTRILDVLDLRPLAWQDSAVCAQVDPTLFDGGEIDSPTPYGKARAICRQCPVQGECLAYALEHNEQYGVWGGLSPAQRKELRRKSPRTKPPKTSHEVIVAGHIANAKAVLARHATHLAEGRNNADAAAALGISTKSYSQRLTRARRLLEKYAPEVLAA